MTGHDQERAYVAAMLDHHEHQLDRASESMAADLDRYRDDFTTTVADQLRAHQDRVRKLEADQAAWLADFIQGETGGTPPTQDVARQIPQDASRSGGGPATTPGPGSAGQPNQITADDIAAMTMAEYQAFRARMGLGNASSRGLLG